MKRQRRYLSYLLRLWQTSDGEKEVWRASLQSPGQDRHGFANLQALFAFLQDQTDPDHHPPLDEPDHGWDDKGANLSKNKK